LARNAKHVTQALGRLLTQFQNKPRLKTLLTIYAEEIQELEDALWGLWALRNPSTLNTAEQDIIGRIVGQPRRGATNAVYSLFLLARIRVNKSSGSGADLVAITALLLGTTPFTYEEFYPGQVVISILLPPAVDAASVAELLHQAKAGGVRLDVLLALDTDLFTTAATVANITDTVLGLADSITPTTGGHLIALL
jgi:hypothetical protein